jgi:two-component system LytT family response regulator
MVLPEPDPHRLQRPDAGLSRAYTPSVPQFAPSPTFRRAFVDPERGGPTIGSLIRAVVVDDDAAARQRVRALLSAHQDVVVVGECSDGREAVEALTTLPIDLIFLNVQMPKLDGFGVLAEVGAERMPLVILTSVRPEFAVRAFEANALDYLLKPFDDARFAAALDRVRRQRVGRSDAAASSAGRRDGPASGAAGPVECDVRLTGLVHHADVPQRTRYPEAMAIKSGAHYSVVRVADVDWVEADGNYAKLYIQGRRRLLTKSLALLEKRVLDRDMFIRVHRSAIVNVRRIVAVEPHFHGELTLVMQDGMRVRCSRRYRRYLEEKLYFTT